MWYRKGTYCAWIARGNRAITINRGESRPRRRKIL